MFDDMVEKAATGLIPPGFNPSRRLRFDMTVAGVLIGVITVLTAHICIGMGYLAWLGVSGYALASDVSTQGKQITSIERIAIEHDLRDAKRQMCKIQQLPKGDPVEQQVAALALRGWQTTLDKAAGEYKALMGDNPQTKPCFELLLGGGDG